MAVDLTNPQTWNRYAYVMNNPTTFIDPLGLYCDLQQAAEGCGQGNTFFNEDGPGWGVPVGGFGPQQVLSYDYQWMMNSQVTSWIYDSNGNLIEVDGTFGAGYWQLTGETLAPASVAGIGYIPGGIGSANAANNGGAANNLPGVPSPLDQIKKDYRAFVQCVGNPWSSDPILWPTQLNPWGTAARDSLTPSQSGPSGMGPNGPGLVIPSKGATPTFKLSTVKSCMNQYPFAPLGGNTYLQPGDVF